MSKENNTNNTNTENIQDAQIIESKTNNSQNKNGKYLKYALWAGLGVGSILYAVNKTNPGARAWDNAKEFAGYRAPADIDALKNDPQYLVTQLESWKNDLKKLGNDRPMGHLSDELNDLGKSLKEDWSKLTATQLLQKLAEVTPRNGEGMVARIQTTISKGKDGKPSINLGVKVLDSIYVQCDSSDVEKIRVTKITVDPKQTNGDKAAVIIEGEAGEFDYIGSAEIPTNMDLSKPVTAPFDFRGFKTPKRERKGTYFAKPQNFYVKQKGVPRFGTTQSDAMNYSKEDAVDQAEKSVKSLPPINNSKDGGTNLTLGFQKVSTDSAKAAKNKPAANTGKASEKKNSLVEKTPLANGTLLDLTNKAVRDSLYRSFQQEEQNEFNAAANLVDGKRAKETAFRESIEKDVIARLTKEGRLDKTFVVDTAAIQNLVKKTITQPVDTTAALEQFAQNQKGGIFKKYYVNKAVTQYKQQKTVPNAQK